MLFNLTISRSSLKVRIIGQSSRAQEENVAKVGSVTSSEGFLVSNSVGTVKQIVTLLSY